MKKDCAYTRKSLKNYLRGHLFKYEQVKIARHLNLCPVCRSEFQSLKKVADTKQLLKDITPPEGLGQRLKATVSGAGRLKVLFYRPLWLAAIVGIFALVYINIIAPRQRDIEIENIEKSLPPAVPIVSAPTITQAAAGAPVLTAPLQQAVMVQPESKPAASPMDPLLVTITPASEKAVRRINDVVRGQDQFKQVKFSETVREIPGSLTARELTAFLNRIEHAGKVMYSRKRFETFPAEQPIPFLMKMKIPAREEPPSQAKTEYKPAEATGAAPPPVSAPTVSAP